VKVLLTEATTADDCDGNPERVPNPSRDGLRRAKLACAHAAGPLAVSVGPALPVLKYISTFRSGDARGAAAGRGGRCGGASRLYLPAARLVGRMLRDILRLGLILLGRG